MENIINFSYHNFLKQLFEMSDISLTKYLTNQQVQLRYGQYLHDKILRCTCDQWQVGHILVQLLFLSI